MYAAKVPIHRITVAMISVMAMFLGLSGCISRPDLSNRAAQIAGVIAGLPGVDDVDDNYQNGFDSGLRLIYDVTMTAGATDAEVANVATTVNSEVGDEFDDYNRELSLFMGEFSVVLNDESDVDELRQSLVRLRALSATLLSGKLTWTEPGDTDIDPENELEVRETAQDPSTVVSAVRDQFGTEQMRVKVVDTNNYAWKVVFPYSQQAQNRLVTAIGPVTADLEQIEIDKDRVSYVEADVEDSPNAATRLMAIIDRIDSGTSGPWRFWWSVDKPTTAQNNLASGGPVSVGACVYYEDSEQEKDPAGHLTQEAIAIQDQLRSKYDTCG